MDIQDPVYRAKLIELPKIIGDWVTQHRSLAGLEILDFGCGEGTCALGFALMPEVGRVVGVDIMPDPGQCEGLARQNLGLQALPPKLSLHQVTPGSLANDTDRFDLVYSWSVFEHVRRDLLPDTIRLLRGALKPGGLLFIQIAPLFYSSEGSHYYELVPERWGHLVNQEDVYRSKLGAATGPGAPYAAAISTLETLNKLTAPELLALVQEGGFEILRSYTTREDFPIPPVLLNAYKEDALRTNQVVLLARPKAN